MVKKLAFLVGLVAATIAAFSVWGSPVTEADQSNSTWAIGYNSSSGYWDRFGLAHPSVHHRVECEPPTSGNFTTKQSCGWGPGDWSVDFYAAPGTTQKFYTWLGGGSSISAKVWAKQPTCSAGASAGGWTVFVDIYVNGSWEGWVSYGHLDQVSVSAGQTDLPPKYVPFIMGILPSPTA